MNTIKLLPLTPGYKEESHQVYLGAILEALEDNSIKNIALSGGYGVGKSSVLKELASQNEKVLQVSLSSMGLTNGHTDGEDSTTNRIQKEIVKQLIYREKPYKTPGSRFRRIVKFNFWRSVSAATLGGLTLTTVFLLAGWTARFEQLFSVRSVDLRFQLVMFVVLFLGIFWTLFLTHNRVTIKGLKVANAEIALTPDHATYFDKFLDEIVYFFEVTKYDIVVFEDIDRFRDSHIFETLRALNTLLNSSKQLDHRSVRFIYAVRDSIFEEIGDRSAIESPMNNAGEIANPDGVGSEVARSNRTKFFDLVIPVVPFITHQNARELIDRIMDDLKAEFSTELIDLAARYLPEMRLIKNVHNEYVIFHEKVFGEKGGELQLRPDVLLSMMLYKNTHLSDFEKIKTGASKLDLLYADSRRLVRENVKRLIGEAAENRLQLSNSNTIASRSEMIGESLRTYLDRLGRHLTLTPQGSPYQLTVKGVTYARDVLQGTDLWLAIASLLDEESFHVDYTRSGYPPMKLLITKADLAAQLSDSLCQSDWEIRDQDTINERLNLISTNQKFILHATFENLYEHSEFETDDGLTFSQLVDIHLKSSLARRLVAKGYLDEYFALYTSSYYTDRVSQKALNFLIHNVDRNVMDIDYLLTPEDVDAILAERGDEILSERGAYNVSILDHLLDKHDKKCRDLLQSLTGLGNDEQEFFRAYFASGKYPDKLVEKLAIQWPQIFSFLIQRQDLDRGRKVSLVDSALENIVDTVEYVVDEHFRSFIEENFATLTIMRNTSVSVKLARAICALFSKSGIRLSSITYLSEAMGDAVVAANCYKITFDNLNQIVASGDIALDQLLDNESVVYAFVIKNLSDYLIDVTSHNVNAMTTASSDSLAIVLADIVENASDLLDDLLTGVDFSMCDIELTLMPEEAWPSLADHDAFPLTFANVKAYIESIGEIDQHLGRCLSRAGVIEMRTDSAETDKLEVAEFLLAAKEFIPEPELRVSLMLSLNLDSYIPYSSVPSEEGPLIGLLMEDEVIEDNAQSYGLALAHDWDTREFAISKSAKFVDYMTASEIPLSDVPLLLKSNVVSNAVKSELVERFDEFIPTDEGSALKAAAEYVVVSKTRLTSEQALRVIRSGVGQDLAINVFSIAVTGLDIEEITLIAEAIGGWVRDLLAKNGKRFKMVNNDVTHRIVQRFKDLGRVSSFKVKGDELTVNLKRP